MKIMTIEIPEGKEAKWVDGVLTLVDEQPVEFKFKVGDKVAITHGEYKCYTIYLCGADNGKAYYWLKDENEVPHPKYPEDMLELYVEQPKDITERIKTFEDACEWCKENGKTYIAMNTKQKEKLDLYREFGDKAKDAYKFIYSEDDFTVTTEETNEDGVYIIYKDGSYQKFDGSNPKENVAKIGVKMGGHSVAISLTESDDEFYLTTERDADEKRKDLYTNGRILAQEDFNGKENTEYLKQYGCNVPLADDEYIPSCGEMMLIAINLTAINEGLDYVGGDKFKEDWYWTSTSLTEDNAWGLYLSHGYLYAVSKVDNSGYVRPVSAFELNALTL